MTEKDRRSLGADTLIQEIPSLPAPGEGHLWARRNLALTPAHGGLTP